MSPKTSNTLLASDLNQVLSEIGDDWRDLKNGRLFLTGGTGFFGCWLLESFLWANEHLGLKAKVVVLTRAPRAFRNRWPHLANNPSLSFLRGDVRKFKFPKGAFSHVIHAATDASAQLNDENPLQMLDVIVEGTRRVLEFSHKTGVKKFLYVSSGAVYGDQPESVPHIAETYRGAPDAASPRSAYGEGKRLGETLCSIFSKDTSLQTKVARCFAFVGPYQPLDRHFAIGNFIGNVLRGEPIRLKGDGSPVRSYLYGADLATWLWKILFRGEKCRPYNVGSKNRVTIKELAHKIADVLGPGIPVEFAKQSSPGIAPDQYVPSTKRAQSELGLRERVSLDEAIRRTAKWHRDLYQTK
ncbi:MAG TPA: NAD-dependent epimerase/dehydratase family protein [Elusimicrobiota bacterium]|nr:NAD-dependent epimerase/dehydratase family protein [Elusimicrobiota bacterium]